ncbi:MAG: hypothetical protein ABI903_09955 [Actinomycetota bacterium]
MHTISHEDPSVGRCTGDFIAEVLHLPAVLDSNRQESIVTRAGGLAQGQHAVAIA